MGKKVLTMREIKKVLQLWYEAHYNKSCISKLTNIPRSTVRDYLLRAKSLNISWPLAEDMTEEQLHKILFPGLLSNRGVDKSYPEWSIIHKELKRKAVTLQLLWTEYKQNDPNGVQYSWFAYKYRQWAKNNNVWMIQPHKVGEKVFVDYSGLTVDIWEPTQRSILFAAEIFVAVLGGSDLIFCNATTDQKLSSWILSHCLMLEFYNGVPEMIVPDNLRSGVSKAHRYEPLCNPTYEDFANHYGCVIAPTRSYKPKDKAKAEKAVQSVQRQILAPKRDHRFTTIEELNSYISGSLQELNNKPMQRLPYSRRELFQQIEQELLNPLPLQRYILAEWSKETVNGSYHVKVYNHYYSVPYTYSNLTVEIRCTANTVECFHNNLKIATHKRDDIIGKCSTVLEHMPKAHQEQAHWNKDNLINWAATIGINTLQLIEKVFANKHRHIKQQERTTLGILRLSHSYSTERLEAACGHALQLGTYSYRSLSSILANGLEQKFLTNIVTSKVIIKHENIRGKYEYH